MVKDTGIVTIDGKEYKTVAKRVDEFRKEHKQELGIQTNLVSIDERTVVIKAEIINKEGFVIATGYAEEDRQSSQINETSALENCETSAIGRALANFGLAGGEYASADEVAQAISQQNQPKKTVKKYGMDFEAIQSQLDILDDEESVNAYAKELKAKYPNPTEGQSYHIRTMFERRLKELKNGSAD